MTDMLSDGLQSTESKIIYQWTDDAQARLERVPEGFMRNMTKAKIEQCAEKTGANKITLKIAEKGLSEAKGTMASMMDSSTPEKKEIKVEINKDFQKE